MLNKVSVLTWYYVLYVYRSVSTPDKRIYNGPLDRSLRLFVRTAHFAHSAFLLDRSVHGLAQSLMELLQLMLSSCCPQWKHAPCTRTMLCSNNAHERDRFHVPVPVSIVKMNAYDYNSAYDYKDKCCQMTELPQYWPGAVQAWALFSQWTKQNR